MASTFNDRVDGISTSVAVKYPCIVATTADITLSAVQTIDGVAVVAEDRVLVKDQTDGTENGIYRCQAAAWVRAADFDGSRDVAQGTLVRVVSGTTHGNSFWEVTTSGTITVGTTSIAFSTTDLSISDPELAAIAGLTSAADKGILFTGSGAASTYDLTAAGRALTDDADVAAQLVTLGLSRISSELTLSTGAVTPTLFQHTLAVESGTTDDLDTITTTNMVDGQMVTLTAASTTTAVVIKDGTGNIALAGDTDYRLFGNRAIVLQRSGSTLVEISRSEPLLPQGFLSGLTLSNNGSDADHDIDIAVGQTVDSGNDHTMRLSSVMTKQLDVAWAIGTAAGGLFTGAIAADTWYHVFLIQHDGTGAVDAGFDTSVTASNIPSGYTAYRRIGAVLTDSSSNIIPFTQVGGLFTWDTPIHDLNTITPVVAATLKVISAPLGVKCHAYFFLLRYRDGTNTQALLVSDPDIADTAADSTNALANAYMNAGASGATAIQINVTSDCMTNTSSQVQIRSNGTAGSYDLRMRAYLDYRGQ